MKAIRSTLIVSALVLGYSSLAHSADSMFYYVSPNPIGVNAFLRMGEVGIEAAGEKHGAQVTVVESDTPQSRLENVSAAANDGAQIVVVLGFDFNDMLAELASLYPETQFLIVDQCIWEGRPDNVSCATFREHEASFLMGALAGLNTKSNKVGAVSAMDIPFLHRYTDAFAEGARHVNEDVSFDVRWVGGQSPFQDPVRSKELALALASEGTDIIFAATAGGDFGIFEAASEKDFLVASVDINHCPSAPGRILDGTLKRVDEVIRISVDRIMAGDVPFVESYGLREGGMSAQLLRTDAQIAASGCLIAEQPDTLETLRALAEEIIDGSVVVDDPMMQ